MTRARNSFSLPVFILLFSAIFLSATLFTSAQECKDKDYKYTTLSNQLVSLKEYIDEIGFCKKVTGNDVQQDVTIYIVKNKNLLEKIIVSIEMEFTLVDNTTYSQSPIIAFDKEESIKKGYGNDAHPDLEFIIDRGICTGCLETIDIKDAVIKDMRISFITGPMKDKEVVRGQLPAGTVTSAPPVAVATPKKEEATASPVEKKAEPVVQKAETKAVTQTPDNSKTTAAVEKPKEVIVDDKAAKKEEERLKKIDEEYKKQVEKDQKESAIAAAKQKQKEADEALAAAKAGKIVEAPIETKVVPASVPVVEKKAEPVPVVAPPPTKPIATAPAAAPQPFSKEEYNEKVRSRVETLQEYLNRIISKKSNTTQINTSIDESLKMFIDNGKNAVVGVSSKVSSVVKKYKVRDYLNNLSRLPYSNVTITWTKIYVVDNFKMGKNGNYFGTISLEQTFSAFNDSKMVYSDVTHKNMDIVLKPYSKIEEGAMKQYWDILLGDMRVAQTE